MGSQYNPSQPNNNNLKANNRNSGLLWGTIIKIWGLHGHNYNNKGAILIIKIRGYTSIIVT